MLKTNLVKQKRERKKIMEAIMKRVVQNLGGDISEGNALIILIRGEEIRRYGEPLCVAKDGEKLNQHCVGANHSYGEVGFRIVAIQRKEGVISLKEFFGENLFPEFVYESRMQL